MLSKWETAFILIMTIPIMGHVIILPLMLDVAGRDSWISVIISLPAAIIFLYAIYKLRLKYPTLYINDLLKELLGKWFGRLMTLLFIIYFLFLTIFSYAMLIDFVKIGFLDTTPYFALMLWFFIFMIYAALKGIKRIALTAGILALIALITGHTLTLMDTPKKDWGELLPILEFGMSPVILGALILLSIWIELIILLFLPIRDIKEKHYFKIWLFAIFIVAFTMNSTTTGVVMIFGLGQATNFQYPAQELVRIVNLAFIDRFDIYGMILMTFGNYIRCSLFLRIAYEMTTHAKPSKWRKRIVFTLFSLIIFICTYLIVIRHFRVEYAIDVYAYMIILYPIPFILLAIATFKQRKETSPSNQRGRYGGI